MKNLFKKLSASIFILMLTLLSFGTLAVSAAPDFQIDKVEVSGVEVTTNGNAVYVERGKTIPVVVWYSGKSTGQVAYDSRVKAWIGGYEHDDVEDSTGIFQIVPNVSDNKVLYLNIPEDIDASEQYTLNVEIYDDDNVETKKYALRIEEPRHSTKIYDVIFNPAYNVKAGQYLFASVRVENLGDNTEDSIKVTLSIPELGVLAEEYIDELITSQDEEDDDVKYAKKDSASTNDLALFIPEDTKAGDYQVKVKLTYNRGHSVEESAYTIHVDAPEQTQESNLLITTEQTQTTELGKGTVYTLSVANLGTEAETYTFEVQGVEGWGTFSVDPSTLTVQPDKTGEAKLYVNPSESTSTGLKSFTVKVNSGENTLEELNLNLDVAAEQSTGYDVFKKVLEVAFIVLLIILVILGIVIIAKKLGSKDEEEPIEGQTYY